MISREELAALTKEYGGDWGLDHTKRLLKLVSIIGEGLNYNHEAVELAAYMHDWGGYKPFLTPGVDHPIKSKEVAAKILDEQECPEDLKALILECIEFHHGGDKDRSIESILLTDADALDLLGVVGTLRIFAMNSRDIKAGYKAVQRYREGCIKAIMRNKSKEIAVQRLEETDYLLETFQAETFGIF